MIGEASAIDGGVNAERNAYPCAENDRHGCKFNRCRQDPRDILHDRAPGQECAAEIAMQQVLEEYPELLEHRQIKAKLLADLEIGCAVGIGADHGNDRIDRHQPTDHECEEHQQEKCRDNTEQRAAETAILPQTRTPPRRPDCRFNLFDHMLAT